MVGVCVVIVRIGTVFTNCRTDGIERARVRIDKHPVEVPRGMLFIPYYHFQLFLRFSAFEVAPGCTVSLLPMLYHALFVGIQATFTEHI